MRFHEYSVNSRSGHVIGKSKLKCAIIGSVQYPFDYYHFSARFSIKFAFSSKISHIGFEVSWEISRRKLEMTSRERVHAALRREPVDRIPIFMWFHPETAILLGEVFEIPSSMVATVMGNDVLQTWVGNNHAMEGIVHERQGETHWDDWGVEWVKEGAFNQIRHYPLLNASEEEILNYSFPYHKMNELLSNMDPIMERSMEMFIGCDISPCVFELLCRLRGMENALLDLVAEHLAPRVLRERAAEFALRQAELACERFALDWLWTGDDVGGQLAMMMSPSCWRAKIKPLLEPIFQLGKSHRLWVAYHSCGSIRPIIPDLIEMGLDVLNPIQSNCPGMNPFELKREFGKELTFMGGVDTQELLPNGTANQVRSEIEKLVEGMTSDGGGYILAASHTIPPETPLENIFAMYEAVGVTEEEIRDRAAAIRSILHKP